MIPSGSSQSSNVGIVTDYVLEGGAEAVTEALCQSFPNSTVYTSLLDTAHLSSFPAISEAHKAGRVKTSVAQALWPLLRQVRALSAYHIYWLCFLLAGLQRTRNHDLVIVTCSAQAKLFRIPKAAKVIVYFHTPTRWLYPGLMTEQDLTAVPWVLRKVMAFFNFFLGPLDRLGMKRLRKHDPVWLCNSHYIKETVAQIYDVDCKVLHPPVNLDRFKCVDRQPEDFFLYHGRLTYQKRVDVAIQGCLLARKKLVISGHCADPKLQAYLEGLVADAERADQSLRGLVQFQGRTSDAALTSLLSTCNALIFPPREDFGITPIEAISCGVPVIAFRAGGALDYIKPGVNGCFFTAQNGESLADVLKQFDGTAYTAETVATSLPDLSVDRFHRELLTHAQSQTVVR